MLPINQRFSTGRLRHPECGRGKLRDSEFSLDGIEAVSMFWVKGGHPGFSNVTDLIIKRGIDFRP